MIISFHLKFSSINHFATHNLILCTNLRSAVGLCNNFVIMLKCWKGWGGWHGESQSVRTKNLQGFWFSKELKVFWPRLQSSLNLSVYLINILLNESLNVIFVGCVHLLMCYLEKHSYKKVWSFITIKKNSFFYQKQEATLKLKTNRNYSVYERWMPPPQYPLFTHFFLELSKKVLILVARPSCFRNCS